MIRNTNTNTINKNIYFKTEKLSTTSSADALSSASASLLSLAYYGAFSILGIGALGLTGYFLYNRYLKKGSSDDNGPSGLDKPASPEVALTPNEIPVSSTEVVVLTPSSEVPLSLDKIINPEGFFLDFVLDSSEIAQAAITAASVVLITQNFNKVLVELKAQAQLKTLILAPIPTVAPDPIIILTPKLKICLKLLQKSTWILQTAKAIVGNWDDQSYKYLNQIETNIHLVDDHDVIGESIKFFIRNKKSIDFEKNVMLEGHPLNEYSLGVLKASKFIVLFYNKYSD